jgi:Mor family transcriptional regulator
MGVKILDSISEEEATDLFRDYCLGQSQRYLNKHYDVSYPTIRRICRQKLVSVFHKNPDLLESMVEKAKSEPDVYYSKRHI